MDLSKIQDIFDDSMRQKGKQSSKPKEPLLTQEQEKSFNDRLGRLNKQFHSAIVKRDLAGAKRVMLDLQQVLRSLNKTLKLVEAKNKLYELAMEKGELDMAIQGLASNRTLMRPTTKIYLETTALLAVAYLRKSDPSNAKPFIKEVLANKNNIKSEATKAKFIEEVINRFDEECALSGLRTDNAVSVDESAVEKEVEMALQLSNDQLYTMLGRIAPQDLKRMLFDIDQFAKLQLTYQEAKLLPAPSDIVEDENAGKTIFRSLKRTIYRALCSKDSEVYQMLFTNGLSQLNGKRAIIAAVTSSVAGLGIAGITLTAFVAALVIRLGIDFYCEHYKPEDITALRRKSA